MDKEIAGITVEKFKKIIDVLEPCMDDYLYIMDIKKSLLYFRGGCETF